MSPDAFDAQSVYNLNVRAFMKENVQLFGELQTSLIRLQRACGASGIA
jgi:hypothetical protein